MHCADRNNNKSIHGSNQFLYLQFLTFCFTFTIVFILLIKQTAFVDNMYKIGLKLLIFTSFSLLQGLSSSSQCLHRTEPQMLWNTHLASTTLSADDDTLVDLAQLSHQVAVGCFRHCVDVRGQVLKDTPKIITDFVPFCWSHQTVSFAW